MQVPADGELRAPLDILLEPAVRGGPKDMLGVLSCNLVSKRQRAVLTTFISARSSRTASDSPAVASLPPLPLSFSLLELPARSAPTSKRISSPSYAKLKLTRRCKLEKRMIERNTSERAKIADAQTITRSHL